MRLQGYAKTLAIIPLLLALALLSTAVKRLPVWGHLPLRTTPVGIPSPTLTPVTMPPRAARPNRGAQFYVSPKGGARGNGSLNNPWDIVTAWGQPSIVRPGDTIYLRGGTYAINYSNGDVLYSSLTGTDSAPITVRAYPGERPILDIDYEVIINGAYTNYWGLEFFCSRSNSKYRVGGGWAPGQPANVLIQGPNLKIINCIFHDLTGVNYPGPDSSGRQGAQGTVVYGSLFYYFGFQAEDHAWGTTAYTQADNVTFSDNMMFQTFNNGPQVYGHKTSTNNITFTGNAIFNCGQLSLPVGQGECLVTSLNTPGNSGFNYSNNFFRSGDVVQFGQLGSMNGSLVMNNNVFLNSRLLMGDWEPSTFRNNQFHADFVNALLDYEANTHDRSKFNWSGNHYSGNASPFQKVYDPQKGSYDLTSWQNLTGLDQQSTFEATRPTGVQVTVRPNQYEQGRAHIIIINWDGVASTQVDLSAAGLRDGQNYSVVDAQNYFGVPLVTGTYRAANPIVTVPLNLTQVAPLVGATDPQNVGKITLPVHTSAEWNTFVVLPR